jgi:hypothetical protein
LKDYCNVVAPAPGTKSPWIEPAVYLANPLTITASRINGFGGHDATGSRAVKLDDGRTITVMKDVLARIDLKVGDYYVSQQDGRDDFIPAEEFRRKYSPAQAEAA